jgi:hypothetical protein
MSLSAFEKYLLLLPRAEAVNHVIDCLRNGPQGNAAWELMGRFNGDSWSCLPEELPQLILATLFKLEKSTRGQVG